MLNIGGFFGLAPNVTNRAWLHCKCFSSAIRPFHGWNIHIANVWYIKCIFTKWMAIWSFFIFFT